MTNQRQPDECNAADFHSEIDDVFGRISGRYDLLCDLFSFYIHRAWKKQVAKKILGYSWDTLLDTAAGTGDIVLRVVKDPDHTGDRKVIASDVSEKMLAIAKKRIPKTIKNIDYRVLDAHSLDGIGDNTIDLYSMSLGLKICDRSKVLSEAFRVLRPGGKLVVLEASNISWTWLHKLYLTYMDICMPVIGWIATSGDTSAYKYLLHGIKGFPSAERLTDELILHGFEDPSFKRLSLGIVAIHVACKPEG